jgi:hypothetical protein
MAWWTIGPTVYALGCVLRDAAGAPVRGSTFLGFMAGHAGKAVPALRHAAPEVAGELEAVVLRAGQETG